MALELSELSILLMSRAECGESDDQHSMPHCAAVVAGWSTEGSGNQDAVSLFVHPKVRVYGFAGLCIVQRLHEVQRLLWLFVCQPRGWSVFKTAVFSIHG